jgi:HlyD family secretion protein
MEKKNSRRWLILGVAVALAAFMAWSFWPRPVAADFAQVRREPMAVTIDEEARTRVRDEYVVSAPFAGRLLRVEVEPGDAVTANSTVLFRIAPQEPDFLDERARSQALALARAARVEEEYARTEEARARALAAEGAIPQAALDRAILARANATASRESAEARLIAPEDARSQSAAVAVTAPLSGRVFRVLQKSETVLPPGAPVVALGDTDRDLEVIAELLSADAVQVAPGARVSIENWGGEAALAGEVQRVEPYGFMKISALGVEEQRVNVIIRITDPPSGRAGLGHGYRVDVRVVVWEDANALVVPSSALFRDNGEWAVFAVENSRVRKRRLGVGRNNGVQAHVLDGLAEGDTVILYPGERIQDGVRVSERNTG